MAALMAAVQAEAERPGTLLRGLPSWAQGPSPPQLPPTPPKASPEPERGGVGRGEQAPPALSQTANTDHGAPHGLDLLPATSTEEVAHVQDLCPHSQTPQDAQGGKNPSPGGEPQPSTGHLSNERLVEPAKRMRIERCRLQAWLCHLSAGVLRQVAFLPGASVFSSVQWTYIIMSLRVMAKKIKK